MSLTRVELIKLYPTDMDNLHRNGGGRKGGRVSGVKSIYAINSFIYCLYIKKAELDSRRAGAACAAGDATITCLNGLCAILESRGICEAHNQGSKVQTSKRCAREGYPMGKSGLRRPASHHLSAHT